MGVFDVWLLLYIPYPGLYYKTHIQNVYNAIPGLGFLLIVCVCIYIYIYIHIYK